MSNSSPLPLYVGHKLVRALKISHVESDEAAKVVRIHPVDAGYHPVELSPSFLTRHNPQPGGYFVLYDDGYVSYSPAEPFESGYTKVEGPRVIDPGHRYRLSGPQVLQFIKKEMREEESNIPNVTAKVFYTVAEGTTSEELLAILIDRTRTLNTANPCRENSLAVTHMEEALHWFEARTKARIAAQVEGTPGAH